VNPRRVLPILDIPSYKVSTKRGQGQEFLLTTLDHSPLFKHVESSRRITLLLV